MGRVMIGDRPTAGHERWHMTSFRRAAHACIALALLLGTGLFHAGTARTAAGLVTAGGRVLLVVGTADTFEVARAQAYAAVDAIELPGARVRRDIGWRATRSP